MSRLLAITLLLVAGNCVPAFANLGETDAQINARYGAPVGQSRNGMEGLELRRYSTGDKSITVMFLGGRSECEIIEKQCPLDFSSEERDAILDSNRSGARWSMTHQNRNSSRWVLNFAAPVAMASVSSNEILIDTVKFGEFVEQRTADQILAAKRPDYGPMLLRISHSAPPGCDALH